MATRSLCGAPFVYMMGMSDTRAMCFLGMALFGLFRGIYESNLYASLFEVIEPRLRSSAVGAMISFAFLVGALAPIILGALKHRLGLGAGIGGLSAVYFLSGLMIAIALIWFFRKDCIEPGQV